MKLILLIKKSCSIRGSRFLFKSIFTSSSSPASYPSSFSATSAAFLSVRNFRHSTSDFLGLRGVLGRISDLHLSLIFRTWFRSRRGSHGHFLGSGFGLGPLHSFFRRENPHARYLPISFTTAWSDLGGRLGFLYRLCAF